MRDAMRDVAGHPREARGDGAAARAIVLERHDVDREAARLAQHFRSAAPAEAWFPHGRRCLRGPPERRDD